MRGRSILKTAAALMMTATARVKAGASPLTAAAVLCVLTARAPAQSGVSWEHGFEWREVGAPGNPDASPDDFIFLRIDGYGPVGGVDHRYRLTLTEVTVAEYFEYVRAYSPYYPGGINDPGYFGRFIYNERQDPNDPGWYYAAGAGKYPADMAWIHAARFANWIHNGRRPERWAFESGAYDMSTFTRLPNGDWEGQATHSPGAAVWIPTLDEWIKGMYYDPGRNPPPVGPAWLSRGGYWMYPIASDAPPVSGFPWTPGAQTSAGEFAGWRGEMFDLGSYPQSRSPWGLLDGSGGRGELLENVTLAPGLRLAKGSGTGGTLTQVEDRLDWIGGHGTSYRGVGFRFASPVPSPCLLEVLVLVLVLNPRPRRMLP